MVQIIPAAQRKPSFSERLSTGIGRGLEMGSQMYQQHQQKEALQGMGLDPRIVSLPPEAQAAYFKQQFAVPKKSPQELEVENENYQTIAQTFGKKFADIWKASPTGGQTQLLNAAIDTARRGGDVEELLNREGIESDPKAIEEPINEIGVKTQDFDKGLTPAERTRRQDARYKTNLPLYQDSLAKRQSHESEKDNLNILEDLSPKISGIERLNIDPRSGDLIIPAFASPEAQQYVKTINDFTRNAKDSYGARVTNFDLIQFMKRLPTLANSEEGRSAIIQQLKIINDINLVREKNLHEVIDEYGGIRNIDYDKAEELARKRSNKQINDLRKEFRSIDKNLDREYDNEVKKLKSITPKNKVAVRRADGNTGYIDKDKVNDFIKIPGNIVL